MLKQSSNSGGKAKNKKMISRAFAKAASVEGREHRIKGGVVVKNKRSTVLYSTLALLAMAGCQVGTGGEDNRSTASGDNVLRVAWWGGQERHTMTLEVIDLFEEKYPDISVEPEYTSWDNYWERLTTQAAGSNLPDVVQLDYTKMNEYISRNLLKDLAPLIEDGSIDLSNVDDVYQDVNTIDDAIYGISLGSNALGMLYNAELFAEHGIELDEGYTYEDMKASMLKLKSALGDGFYGYDFNNTEFDLFFAYARQNGESVFNETGDGLGYSDETLVSYFQFIQGMVEEEAAPPHELTMEYIQGGDSTIADGTTSMLLIASNQIIGQQALTEAELDLKPLPEMEGGTEGNWIRPSMSFAISEHTNQEEHAALFIDFITNDPEANEILQAERGVPISAEIRSHLEGKVSPEVEKTFAYLEYVAENSAPADPLPPPGESEVRAAFLRVVESLKYGQTTPEDGAEQFRQQAESILK
ncbi:lactose ABC transporter substrate-binding protein [Shouchella clausii KSM-K16]|uniref:Lactose ABC transporter substrate-binding protein n=1 Tax=Shouchella clausii (strain KSM-K16) TaxID=66692 RepID=Q5WL19_SHOC1|nr:lactose ABC transporter substrate-binding protein [Shouchella clausii KSM-K16]